MFVGKSGFRAVPLMKAVTGPLARIRHCNWLCARESDREMLGTRVSREKMYKDVRKGDRGSV